jgi:hypothetical protein
MLFLILLLLGIMSSSFGMILGPKVNTESIVLSQTIGVAASSDNNPFVPPNDPDYFNRYNQGSIPSAPCNNCLQNDEIFKRLKSKNLISKDFQCNNNDNVQELLGKAIDEKSIANERMQVVAIFNELNNLDLPAPLKRNIEIIYGAHLKKDLPSINEFVIESVGRVKSFYQADLPPKVAPWTISDNLNNALKLIHSDVYSDGGGIVSLSFVSVIASTLFPFLNINLAIPILNINMAIPAYCFFKGLLAHSGEKYQWSQCKCHNKENNTFKCAYRWIYIGVGLLFLIRTYSLFLPFFARKLS